MDGGIVEGNLDNFAGVHSVMQAYFSGRLVQPFVRIELTYGEETGMAGAREVQETLDPTDVVIVVDVTGAESAKDLSIEKCQSRRLAAFIARALAGMSYDLHEGCPDPISNMDEVEVYRDRCEHVCFLGIPCTGGDYNAGAVRCRQASLAAAAEAICRLAEHFGEFDGR